MLNKIWSHNLISVLRCKCSGDYSKLIKCALRAALNVSIEAWSITLAGNSFQSAIVLTIKLFLYVLVLLAIEYNYNHGLNQSHLFSGYKGCLSFTQATRMEIFGINTKMFSLSSRKKDNMQNVWTSTVKFPKGAIKMCHFDHNFSP